MCNACNFLLIGTFSTCCLTKIRISLKDLESLSYNLVKAEDLNDVFKRIKQLGHDVEELVPKDSGIVLRPDQSILITAKKIKL